MNPNAPARKAARGKKAATAVPRPFSADELSRIGSDIAAQWFRPVETNFLTLMEIDPWNVHACWHIAADDLAAARAQISGQGRDAALLLRFTDIAPRLEGAAPQEQFDIEVGQASNNWYVNLWRDAWHYSAQLGLCAADGAFIPLLRSNEVTAPRAGPSPELDFRELEIRAPGHTEPVYHAVGGPDIGDFLLRDLFPKRLQARDDYPLAVAEAGNLDAAFGEPEFPSLNPEADEDEVAREAVDANIEDFSLLAADEAAPEGGADIAARVPSGHFPFITAAELAPCHDLAKQTKRRVLARASIPPLPPVAPEAVAPGGVELSPQPLPIPQASERSDMGSEAVAPSGAEPQPPSIPQAIEQNNMAVGVFAGRSPVALEALLGEAVFSHMRGEAPAQAAAHVVITGQAAPDTPVTLFGQRVPLEADGSFALQLPLQRGPELVALLYRYGKRGEG